MNIEVVTIFPALIESFLAWGVLGRAIERERLRVRAHDLRQWTHDRHRSVDDEPYGGGAGMVMSPAPFFEAVDALRGPGGHVVLLSAKGAKLDQFAVGQLAQNDQLVLLCGRYEGVDERVAELADEEVSIGDFVLAGGELGALVIIEAVARLLPGVLGNEHSLEFESHDKGKLEYPQYTRPASYRGLEVPQVLLSGDHAAIERWRSEQSERLTHKRRQKAQSSGDVFS
ncbi:MAG TPA: tRNA (guanosine(37)-N1)-methyltransferase TrmD [Actinomycetota bacterium]|nr:tRNA (guanosine(37)-N1)-methyltransferase TrmD [Actinomycetota bacterium]